MPSTYTDSLRLEEQGVGENNNTWGNKLNATIDLIDKSIAGHVSVATTGGAVTLTSVNNGEDQARYKIIEVTGTLGSNVTIEVPAVSKEYIVWDSTVRGGFTVSFRIGAAGSTVLIPAATARAFGISTDGTAWRPLSADLATETTPGIVQLSTTGQAQTGTDDSTALTPAKLQSVTATATRKGVIELATTTEAQAGTDDVRAITSVVLQGMDPTETIKSPTRVATTAEARTGTANNIMITPLRLQEVTATETRKGVIEIATQAEVDNGTDTDRAVVPLKLQTRLKSYVDTRLGTTSNLSLGTASTKDFGTGTGDLPEYQEAIVTLGGNFNAGERIKCIRIGNQVTLSMFEGALSHTSTSTPSSATGVIPTWARPSGTSLAWPYNLFYANPLYLSWAYVTDTGILEVEHHDWAGAFSPRDITRGFSMTYAV